MAKTERVYRHKHPNLAIKSTGGKQLGRCYYATYYEVTSLSPLDRSQLNGLRELGFLGSGQEFIIRGLRNSGGGLTGEIPEEKDWRYKPDPTGEHTVKCSEVDVDTGKVIACPSTNPYSGKKDPPTKVPFYVYEIESRVDSSD